MPAGDPVATVDGPRRSTDKHVDTVADSPPGDTSIDPMDLRAVGGGTAAIIKGSSFDAGDILARNVSYTMLRDAGVKDRVAEELRRAYSLVWSFYWTNPSDLRERAARLTGLSEAEREWIAASVPAGSGPDETTSTGARVHRVRGRLPEPPRGEPTLAPPRRERERCPQCGAALSTWVLGRSTTSGCESCEYTGLTVR